MQGSIEILSRHAFYIYNGKKAECGLVRWKHVGFTHGIGIMDLMDMDDDMGMTMWKDVKGMKAIIICGNDGNQIGYVG